MTGPSRYPLPDPRDGRTQDAPEDQAPPAAGDETGFWDDHGRPAPWPDDIDEWRPTTTDPVTLEPGQEPF